MLYHFMRLYRYRYDRLVSYVYSSSFTQIVHWALKGRYADEAPFRCGCAKVCFAIKLF